MVEHSRVQRRILRVGLAVAHDDSAASTDPKQPLVAKPAVGSSHRVEVDAEISSELPTRRKLIPRLHFPAGDRLAKGALELLFEGYRAVRINLYHGTHCIVH